MQKYVDQLIQRMKEAESQAVDPIDPRLLYPDHPSMEYEGLEYIAKIERDEPTAGEEMFGIAKDEFPSVERLTDTQLESLYNGICELLNSINNKIILPDEMPWELKYPLAVSLWDEGFMNLRGSPGFWNFDFCTGEPEGCAMEEYCPCKDY